MVSGAFYILITLFGGRVTVVPTFPLLVFASLHGPFLSAGRAYDMLLTDRMQQRQQGKWDGVYVVTLHKIVVLILGGDSSLQALKKQVAIQ